MHCDCRRITNKASSSPNVNEPVQGVENAAENEEAYEMVDPLPAHYTALSRN